MSMLELSDLMHTNPMEKGKSMIGVDLVANSQMCAVRGHRISWHSVLEPLVLHSPVAGSPLKLK